MRYHVLFALGFPLVPLVLGFTDSSHHARSRNRAAHRNIASAVLDKRQGFGGRATFYDVGLGACGSYNGPGDFIVALNAPQFGKGYPGPNCGRALTISYGGKTATATVMDQCPGCGYGDLDMSRGLFNFFASEDMGTFHMSWSWADSMLAPEPTTSPPPPPPSETPTTTAAPTTTTQSTSPSSSSTTTTVSTTITSSSATSSSSSASTTASSRSTTSAGTGTALRGTHTGTISAGISGIGDIVASSVSVSASALPTALAGGMGGGGQATGVEAGEGNWVLFSQIVANLGRVVIVGAQV